MSTTFAYPTDEPALLEERRAVLERSASHLAELGDTLASARSVALVDWSGITAQAADTAFRTRIAAAEDSAARLRSTVMAVEQYRAVIVAARAEIDELRDRQNAVSAARASTDAAARAFIAAPSADGVADYLRCLARQTVLHREAVGLANAYDDVMRRVAVAAAACATTLWEDGPGLTERARHLAEQAGVRNPQHDPEPNGTSYPDGLGPMVPGTTIPMPEAPPWPDADPGAGEHNSEFAWPDDYLTHQAALAAATALQWKWPNASENLRHFLGNSGRPLEQDVDQMLVDLPGLSDEVARSQSLLTTEALARARAASVTEPVTFPVSTGWKGYYAKQDESTNWYYATGGFRYSLQGQVTVQPPTSPGGEWTYEQTTTVSTYDRYNWDGGKSTQIFGQTVTDEQLAELHRAGIAQEYHLYGTSSPSTSGGSE
ncbi:hypothetical protein [Cellulomonas bogoriensis]|uniref:Uncharacterized protein n=1 Tax=Cellulomonas bogoriensis 69B4 = DSM 16987 TaxID=1386082 RepID=A0A0A0BPK4_9CELL|nr:hypothetical protein [Cellulomonas bogoriensis]KGM09019.1 hypothetical protein N869_08580 [Cellulomonas bogoriensis 69B4 = DSM 16987]